MRRSVVQSLTFIWLAGTLLCGLQLLSRIPKEETPSEATGDQSPNRRGFPPPILSNVSSLLSSQGPTASDGVQSKEIDEVLRFPRPVANGNRTGWKDYFRFRNTGSDRIWPKVGEDEDRILNQLHLTHSGTSFKKILMYDGLDPGMTVGQSRFLDHGCPVNRCLLTANLSDASSADAVLFRSFVFDPLIHRPDHQIWIVFLLESAVNRFSLQPLANKINWTATYRTDSTIVTPYERFTFFDNYTGLPPMAPRNFAAGKTKKVAWLVSNCGAANGRHNYVNELKKYIDVDIFGSCGTLRCVRGTKECDRTIRQYKFYLAFENSNCVDYITEKMYWNAFGRNLSDSNDVLPVVMGARPEDYIRLAPPKSFIHVDDFESPKDLAEYLLKVDQDDDLYNSYFRWKGTGEFIDTKFWCRLCAMIHEANRSKHHVMFNNIGDWWSGDGACVSPPDGKGWASWRNTRRTFDRSGDYFTSWVGK